MLVASFAATFAASTVRAEESRASVEVANTGGFAALTISGPAAASLAQVLTTTNSAGHKVGEGIYCETSLQGMTTCSMIVTAEGKFYANGYVEPIQ